jgi:D-sedoheptulose 7-phosphate isomerase
MTEQINIHRNMKAYVIGMLNGIAALDSNNELQSAFLLLRDTINRNGKIIVFGNGGSAAIANHWATDFGKGVATSTRVRPRVISLSANDSMLTALANDHTYGSVYERQLATWLDPNDVVVAISSSGNSVNIINAVRFARNRGNKVIGLSGFRIENQLVWNSDISIHVPVENYGIVEDVHSMIMHVLAQSLRKEFALSQEETSNFTF